MDAIKRINKLVHMREFRRQQIQMFYDFVERSAIMISGTVDPVHLASRAERLSQIEADHTSEELSEMNGCLKTLVLEIKEKALSGVFDDILGRAFEECGLCDNGQDFTFPDVARIISNLSLRRNYEIPEMGFIDFYDGTCGSGSLILAVAEELYNAEVDHIRKMIAFACDIDKVCVHMTYIQLSQHGIPAVVALGNTITEQEVERWYTPMYVFGKWVIRRPFKGNAMSDYALKRSTIPYYDTIRRALELETPHSKNNLKEMH